MQAVLNRRSVLLVLGSAAFLLAASCASAHKTARTTAGDHVVLDKNQYEEVYVTGSKIPILVPKGESTARALPTISPVQTMSPEAFTNAMRRQTPVRR